MLRPKKVMSLLDRMSATVGTPDKLNLDREMTPILAELLTVRLTKNDQPAVILQLFNWFVDPYRTGEEFFYVMGPLKRHVLTIMNEHFKQYLDDENCLGLLAAEALATKNPILEGFWELVGWLLVMENRGGAPSNRLSAWLIQVIGDPIVCPNPYLRFELVYLLQFLIDHSIVLLDGHNMTKAYESVMFACSSININYLLESDGCVFHQMNVWQIHDTFEWLAQDEKKLKFDDNLAEKLLVVKTLRISDVVHDVAYQSAVNPNRYAQPMELYGLTALLEIAAEYTHVYHKQWQIIILDNLRDINNIDEETRRSLVDLLFNIKNITQVLNVLIVNFKNSCKTPQLIDLTSSCIMNIMELGICVYLGCPDSLKQDHISILHYIDGLLEELFDENGNLHITNSPVALDIILKYKGRLKLLRRFQYHIIELRNIRALLLF